MNKLFTIIFLFISLQISASEKHSKTDGEMIEAVASVKLSPAFVKPRMENLNKVVVDRRLARTAVQVPSMRKQSKRYRQASAPGLQKKISWVFAY